jgi:hypothetical protein
MQIQMIFGIFSACPIDRPLLIEDSAFVERVTRSTKLVRDQAGPEKMCL